ncbi:MAG: hypothetical protein NT007_05275 [Candidatus Kapabacteria bacterium]|nr:hypothetical protein [Candidatus Kapabacteria bacterium]
MGNKLRHIAAILLLVVFPLASMNLHFSVRKCNSRGLLQIIFYNSELSFKLPSLDFLTSSGLAQLITKPVNIEKDKKKPSCCQNKQEPADVSDDADDCELCQNPNQTETSDSDNDFAAFKTIHTACCSNSLITCSVQGSFIVSDTAHTANIEYSAAITDIGNTKLANNYKVHLKFKDIYHPLKEPISNIISFIHFTSNAEDTDASNTFS